MTDINADKALADTHALSITMKRGPSFDLCCTVRMYERLTTTVSGGAAGEFVKLQASTGDLDILIRRSAIISFVFGETVNPFTERPLFDTLDGAVFTDYADGASTRNIDCKL